MRPRLVKLVRDHIGRFVGDSTVSYEPLPYPALPGLLRTKLVEEAVEYLQDPTLGELADLLEVLRGLARHDLMVPWEAVEREAWAKRQERGGFDEGVGMYVQTTAPARHETTKTAAPSTSAGRGDASDG